MYNLVEMGLACETTMLCMLLSKFLCYPIARVSHAICRIFEFCALIGSEGQCFCNQKLQELGGRVCARNIRFCHVQKFMVQELKVYLHGKTVHCCLHMQTASRHLQVLI